MNQAETAVSPKPSAEPVKEANTAPKPQRPAKKSAWRPELHGVRGIAILLVVVFHIFGHGRVSGGIDIFLAITGFLAVPSLYKRSQQSKWGLIDLKKRFGGLARRLLVPLAPVLVVIGIAGSYVYKHQSLGQLYAELKASSLFTENLILVSSQLAYGAAGPNTSPLQHLWSTSIQMQFHILMPLMFMLLTIPAAKLRKNPRIALVIILLVMTAASLYYATKYQHINQEANYFSSLSRTWELTLPGILGLIIDRIKLPRMVRIILGWCGLIMIFSTGFIFDGAKYFPGPEALLPVCGLLLILIAGQTESNWSADRVLATKPIVFFADISYSLYLWHWPLIIFVLKITGRQKLNLQLAAAVFVVATLLGFAGKKLLEDKVASLPYLKSNLNAFITAVAVVTIMALSFQLLVTKVELKRANAALDAHVETKRLQEEASKIMMGERNEFIDKYGIYAGAATIVEGVTIPQVEALPRPSIAENELPVYYDLKPIIGKSCPIFYDDDYEGISVCVGGKTNGSKTIMFIGGSHIIEWYPAFEEMAKKYDWKLVFINREACQFAFNADEQGMEGIRPQCDPWAHKALEYALKNPPNLLVTESSSFRYKEASADGLERVRQGFFPVWDALAKENIPLLVVRNNPKFDKAQSSCLIDNPQDKCFDTRQSRQYSKSIDAKGIIGMPPGTAYADTAKILCPGDKCPAVIGNVTVWRDSDHLTVAYAKTAEPFFEQIMRKSHPDLFK